MTTNTTALLTDNILRYHSFDNDVGTTAIDDTNNANSTLIGAPNTTTGILNTGLSCDGIDDTVSFNTVGDFAYGSGENWTMSIWIRNATLDGSTRLIGVVTGAQQIDIGGTPSIGISFTSNPGGSSPTTHQTLYTEQNGSFTHFVFMRDGTTIKTFLDAQLVNSTAGASSGAYSVISAAICKYGSIAATEMEVVIDEYGMWNRALNDTEIEQLYNNGTGCGYPFTSCTTNTVPVMQTVTLTPAGDNTTVTINANATDADLDTLTYQYTLYLNTTNLTSGSFGGSTQGVLESSSAIPITLDGTYIAEVYADDGMNLSAPLNSSGLPLTFPTTPPSVEEDDIGAAITVVIVLFSIFLVVFTGFSLMEQFAPQLSDQTRNRIILILAILLIISIIALI